MLSVRFSSCADFAAVYIEEAHPAEAPNFGGNVQIDQHKTIKERVEASKMLEQFRQNKTDFNILVDLMQNKASKAYAALPERLYIIKDGVIIYEGGQGPFDCKLEDVEEFLENFEKKIEKEEA